MIQAAEKLLIKVPKNTSAFSGYVYKMQMLQEFTIRRRRNVKTSQQVFSYYHLFLSFSFAILRLNGTLKNFTNF